MVTFTPHQIDAKTKGVSFTPFPNQKPKEQVTVNPRPWEDRAIGFTQSLLGTAVGTARGLQEVGLGVMGAFGADTSKYGLQSLRTDSAEGKSVTEALTPKTQEQAQGKMFGDVAQYVVPASKITKATASLPAMERLFARIAPDIATSMAQSIGADTGQTTKNAITTGLVSGVANALLPGTPVSTGSSVARTIGSGYASDVITGLAGQRGEDRTGINALKPGFGTGLSTAIAGIQIAPAIKQAMQERAVNRAVSENNDVYTKRYNALNKLQQNNKPLDRIIKVADKSGIDTKRMIAESDLLVGVVDTNGTINTKNSLDNFDDMLQPYEANVGEALAAEGKRVPIEDLKNKLLATIDDSGLVGAMKQQARNRALSEIESLADEVDEAGTVSLKLVHDLKVQTNKTNAKSYIDPEKNAVGKIYGRGLKEFVEESTDALDVKKYNAELRKLYAIRDVLRKLDGKKVEGGRMGKYFAQTAGALAGSTVGGPIGAVVGAEVGGAIKGAQMTRAFGGLQGNAIRPSQDMLDALKAHPKISGPRQISQTMNTTMPKNAIDATVPQPAKLSSELSTKIAEQTQNNIIMGLIDEGNKDLANLIAKIDMTGATSADDIARKISDIAGQEVLKNPDVLPHIQSARQIFDFQLEKAKELSQAMPAGGISTASRPGVQKNSSPNSTARKVWDAIRPGDTPNKQGGMINPGAIADDLMGKGDNALMAEARKYKSAEEFVKAQRTPIYHGADQRNLDALNKNGVKMLTPEEKLKLPSTGGGNVGISMTTDADTAKAYSQAFGNKNIGEFYLNPNAKVKTISTYIDDTYSPEQLEKLQKQGYDAIVSTAEEHEVRVLSNKAVKTHSQLTDIYNRAHGKQTSTMDSEIVKKLTRERGAVGSPSKEWLVNRANAEMNSINRKLDDLQFKYDQGKISDNAYFDKVDALESYYDSIKDFIKRTNAK